MNFSAFTLIYDKSKVLSAAFVTVCYVSHFSTELKELLHDPAVVAEDVNCVAASALKLVELLTWFEFSEIRIHQAE